MAVISATSAGISSSRQPRRWWYVPTLGMLGSALPTAIAAKLAYPDSRVVMLTGDSAFGFNAMEFDTASRHHPPVVGILGNDSAWGIDRQIQLGSMGVLWPPTCRAITRWWRRDWEATARRRTPGRTWRRPLERAFASGKPALVNVAVQRAISPRAEGHCASKPTRSGSGRLAWRIRCTRCHGISPSGVISIVAHHYAERLRGADTLRAVHGGGRRSSTTSLWPTPMSF
jgi:hypothetical protein